MCVGMDMCVGRCIPVCRVRVVYVCINICVCICTVCTDEYVCLYMYSVAVVASVVVTAVVATVILFVLISRVH